MQHPRNFGPGHIGRGRTNIAPFTLRYVSGNPALYLPQEHDSYLKVSWFALALHEHFETNPYRI
jgi:hypothetical protein